MTTKKNTTSSSKSKALKAIADKTPARAPKASRVTLHMHANGAAFSEARPGCIAVLVARCIATSEAKPITKKELVAYMCEKFPDRVPAQLKSTCTGQLPSQLRGEKGLVMREILDESSTPPTRTGKFYFDPEATDALRAEQNRPPLVQSKQFGGKPPEAK